MKAFPSGWLLLLHLRGYMRFQTVLKSPAADHKSIGESRIARVPMLTWGRRCGCCPVRWQTSLGADRGICYQVPCMMPCPSQPPVEQRSCDRQQLHLGA